MAKENEQEGGQVKENHSNSAGGKGGFAPGPACSLPKS